MGSEAARANIHSISAVAECRGPKGFYQTRLISGRDGNLSFQQFLSDHKNIAGIADGRGWQLNEDGRYEWIDATETFVLRGHEFQVIALDLTKRFHDFKAAGRAEFDGKTTNRVDMVDELGHTASGYFSLTSRLPAGLIVTNPRDTGARTITIQFDGWRLTGGVNLVSHVTILQGSDTWVFDFKDLTLNTADNASFQIPASLAASQKTK